MKRGCLCVIGRNFATVCVIDRPASELREIRAC